jgi:hypothetical protein
MKLNATKSHSTDFDEQEVRKRNSTISLEHSFANQSLHIYGLI